MKTVKRNHRPAIGVNPVKPCPDCDGGEVLAYGAPRMCRGQGGPYEPEEIWDLCTTCDGTGEVPMTDEEMWEAGLLEEVPS